MKKPVLPVDDTETITTLPKTGSGIKPSLREKLILMSNIQLELAQIIQQYELSLNMADESISSMAVPERPIFTRSNSTTSHLISHHPLHKEKNFLTENA